MGEKAALGGFEHQVLLAVLRLEAGAYTAAIVRELESVAGRTVSAAAVYIALRRLESQGCVRSRLRRGAESGGRRERRYFEATNDGIELAREARRQLTRLWRGVDVLRAEG